MRRLLYIMLVGVLFFVPLERLNVGDLAPVSAISIRHVNGKVELGVDVGYRGTGKSVLEALEMMNESALSVIYLDTAEYLVVPPDSTYLVAQLHPYVKGTTKVFVTELWQDLGEQKEYLSIHGEGVKMRDWGN